MILNIGFVACAKTKRVGTHPARDIYVSPLFRKAFTFAITNCEQVFILSAKYGLLLPSKEILSYDQSLTTMNRNERALWSATVALKIHEVASKKDGLFFYCGRLYRDELMSTLSPSYRCYAPLAGLSIGKQLSWYKNSILK